MIKPHYFRGKKSFKICTIFHKFLNMDFASNEDASIGTCMGIQMEINMWKPLLESFSNKHSDGKVDRVRLRYERLPNVCFKFGEDRVLSSPNLKTLKSIPLLPNLPPPKAPLFSSQGSAPSSPVNSWHKAVPVQPSIPSTILFSAHNLMVEKIEISKLVLTNPSCPLTILNPSWDPHYSLK